MKRLVFDLLTVVGYTMTGLICLGCSGDADERRGEDVKQGFCTVVADVGGISWDMTEPGVDDSGKSVTRGLEADGETLKELWVFDCYEDSCALVAKQTDADDSFGVVAMRLGYGKHRLAFVASRGEGSSVDVKNGRIEWDKVKDSFWCCEDVDVVRGGAVDMAVTLKRIVGRLRVMMYDVVPSGMKKMRITAEGWYRGVDVRTGEAVGTLEADEGITEVSLVDIPAAYVGTSKRLAVSMWCVGRSEQWTQTVGIAALDSDGGVIGETSCDGVPMERNRVTQLGGYFLSGGKSGNVSVDDSWGGVLEYEF